MRVRKDFFFKMEGDDHTSLLLPPTLPLSFPQLCANETLLFDPEKTAMAIMVKNGGKRVRTG